MVYNRMNQDTSHLLDSVRADPATRPPFFWHHIRPDCQRWAIMEIWRNAGPLTRPLFDRGGTNGEYRPNWVAGWLLYSVFRSRDVRNNRNRRKGENGNSDSGEFFLSSYFCFCCFVVSVGLALLTWLSLVDRRKQETPPPKKGYYDPVRNGTIV